LTKRVLTGISGSVGVIAYDNVCNRWRDGGDWWKNETDREYIKLVTEEGLLCVIVKDVGGDDVWVVGVYDSSIIVLWISAQLAAIPT